MKRLSGSPAVSIQKEDDGRFRARRIAVTVPPDEWFHGIARGMFDIYRAALADLGFDIFDVPVEAFFPPNPVRIASLLSGLQTFQPELAFVAQGQLRADLPLAGSAGWLAAQPVTEVLEVPRSASGTTRRWSWPISC